MPLPALGGVKPPSSANESTEPPKAMFGSLPGLGGLGPIGQPEKKAEEKPSFPPPIDSIFSSSLLNLAKKNREQDGDFDKFFA